MKQLLKKEALQALIPFLIVCAFVSGMWLSYQRTESLLAPDFKVWLAVIGASGAAGALFGYMQFWGERWLKTMPYLVHRWGGHSMAFRAKLVVGLAFASLMLIGPPLVFLAWHEMSSGNAGIIPSARVLELAWLLPDAWLGYACGVLASQLRRADWIEAIGMLFAAAGALLVSVAVGLPITAPVYGALHALTGCIGSAVLLWLGSSLFRAGHDHELPLAGKRETTAALAFAALCGIGLSIVGSFGTVFLRQSMLAGAPKIVRIESNGSVRAVARLDASAAGREILRTSKLDPDPESGWAAVDEHGVPLEPLELLHNDAHVIYRDPPKPRVMSMLFDLEDYGGVSILPTMYPLDQARDYWESIYLPDYEGSSASAQARVVRCAWLNRRSGTIEAFWLVNENKPRVDSVIVVAVPERPDSEVSPRSTDTHSNAAGVSYPGSLPLARTLTKPGSAARFSRDTEVWRWRDGQALLVDNADRTISLLDLNDQATPIRSLTLPGGDQFVALEFGMKHEDLAVGHWSFAKWLLAGEKDYYFWDGKELQHSAQWDPKSEYVVGTARELEARVELRARAADDEPYFPNVEVRDLKSGAIVFSYHYRPTNNTQAVQLRGLELLALCAPTFESVLAFLRNSEEIGPIDLPGLPYHGQNRGWLLVLAVALSGLCAWILWRRLSAHGASSGVRMAYAIGCIALGVPASVLLLVMVPRVRIATELTAQVVREPVLLPQTA